MKTKTICITTYPRDSSALLVHKRMSSSEGFSMSVTNQLVNMFGCKINKKNKSKIRPANEYECLKPKERLPTPNIRIEEDDFSWAVRKPTRPKLCNKIRMKPLLQMDTSPTRSLPLPTTPLPSLPSLFEPPPVRTHPVQPKIPMPPPATTSLIVTSNSPAITNNKPTKFRPPVAIKAPKVLERHITNHPGYRTKPEINVIDIQIIPKSQGKFKRPRGCRGKNARKQHQKNRRQGPPKNGTTKF